jgi:site-specific recombinase XerD
VSIHSYISAEKYQSAAVKIETPGAISGYYRQEWIMELAFVVVENELDYYLDLFLSTKRPVRSEKTILWYENSFRFYKNATGRLPGWPVEVAHLVAFFEAMKEVGLAGSSRNNYWRAIRAFLNWCHKNGFIRDNPARLVDPPKAPRPLPKAPARADMTRLLKTVNQAAKQRWQPCRDYALFSLALDTGARIGELARMKIDDVDLLNGQISVYASKTGRGRTLVVSEMALTELAHWIARRMELGLPKKLRHLWVSDYRGKGFRALTSWGMRQRLRFWQGKAGIPRFTFHGFRHAYAIYSLRNGADLLDVRDQLGHTSIMTTAIYTECVPEGRRERHQKTSPRANL